MLTTCRHLCVLFTRPMGVVWAMLALLLACVPTYAQLRPEQVLVVYDSRIADSLAVAEYYAGSAKVSGGVGGLAGKRPGVRVCNLAPLAASTNTQADVTYADFVSLIRTPIRTFLTSNNLTLTIRCIVLTKGLPHRIRDTDSASAGDNPPTAGTEYNAGDYTAASVDSELTLLWQTLNTGENGGTGDSISDGWVLNPYGRQSQNIGVFSSRNIASAKQFSSIYTTAGVGWRAISGAASAQLTAGDIYLVCRLDGNTVQAVKDIIDRAQNVYVDVNSANFVLDESYSNGIADAAANNELDNQGPAEVRVGDDYEQSRDALVADGRFAPANIRYDRFGGAANFLVGPRVNYGGGTVITAPILLLATEGANHGILVSGVSECPPGAANGYPFSFNYAPGCVFNSIESANGRNYNGIGSNFGQASSSDALASGCTFAFGNVWEPFTFSLPDNLSVVRNFFLGNLTWGEAAYTALPVLSFQQIVVGDPLARVVRSSEDINGDGLLTIDDVYAWALHPLDINRDGLANATDRKLIDNSLRANEALGMSAMQR